MSKPHLERPRTRWERPGAWTATSVVALTALAVAAATWVATSGAYFVALSAHGVILGIIATALGAASLAYSVRKRRWTNGAPALEGTMLWWLWSHVALGGLALCVALLHVGRLVGDPRWSSGWLLMAASAVLVASGVAWRLVYDRIPKRRQKEIRNYSTGDALDRARIHDVEMERLAAGRGDQFGAFVSALRGGTDAAQVLDDAATLEADDLEALRRVADHHSRAAAHRNRAPLQARTHAALQLWRVVHVPAALLTVVLLPLHIVGATSEVAWFQRGSEGFASAERCGDCHAAEYEEWRSSMHAHALTSPVNLSQTYGVTYIAMKDQPHEVQRVCVNCHSPLAARLVGGDGAAPLETTNEVAREGVTCVVCHQFAPSVDYPNQTGGYAANSAIGAWPDLYERLSGGRVVRSFEGDEGTSLFHDTRAAGMRPSSALCASCHNVQIDRDKDGRITAGSDLILQSLYDEWAEHDGQTPCLQCHGGGPARHGFVGVDFPIDDPAARDHTYDLRRALLANVVSARVARPRRNAGRVLFDVILEKKTGGHRFPSGFAFARQAWLEVVVRDGRSGARLLTSGVLEDDATSDLCDANTVDGALGPHLLDCDGADPQLVNLQGQLVRNERERGPETVLQHFEGAALPRSRRNPETGVAELLTPLSPGDSKSYTYAVAECGRGCRPEVRVRVRFRNLPPYFLRALHARVHEGLGKGPDVEEHIENLQVIDIHETRAELQLADDGEW